MEIKLGKGGKAISFFVMVGASMVLTILAAAMKNEFWSYPLIALAVLFVVGGIPNTAKSDKFEWFFALLVVGSGALLLFTPEQFYWTTPLVLGIVFRLVKGSLIL